jgi:hypothetical protein
MSSGRKKTARREHGAASLKNQKRGSIKQSHNQHNQGIASFDGKGSVKCLPLWPISSFNFAITFQL